jgi:hypothetical protein
MNRRQQNLHKKKVNSKIGTRTVRHSLGLWAGGSVSRQNQQTNAKIQHVDFHQYEC